MDILTLTSFDSLHHHHIMHHNSHLINTKILDFINLMSKVSVELRFNTCAVHSIMILQTLRGKMSSLIVESGGAVKNNTNI